MRIIFVIVLILKFSLIYSQFKKCKEYHSTIEKNDAIITHPVSYSIFDEKNNLIEQGFNDWSTPSKKINGKWTHFGQPDYSKIDNVYYYTYNTDNQKVREARWCYRTMRKLEYYKYTDFIYNSKGLLIRSSDNYLENFIEKILNKFSFSNFYIHPHSNTEYDKISIFEYNKNNLLIKKIEFNELFPDGLIKVFCYNNDNEKNAAIYYSNGSIFKFSMYMFVNIKDELGRLIYFLEFNNLKLLLIKKYEYKSSATIETEMKIRDNGKIVNTKITTLDYLPFNRECGKKIIEEINNNYKDVYSYLKSGELKKVEHYSGTVLISYKEYIYDKVKD